MKITYLRLEPHHLKDLYEIRFSVTENLLHAHQIKYLQRKQAVEDIRQGGGWICKSGNEYLGYGFGIFAPEPLIGGLFVKPEFQRNGIGRNLIEKITNWFTEKDIHSIMLTTDKGSNAEFFYKKNGWYADGMDEYGQLIMRREV
ncbi:GNAT family N-acetyltransferase [Serratia symbiotica]|uniref:GNAT family N-acetyltransferase n=1 Tax=Serratia symbiotica TaxID=138074 RepID=UPI00132ACF72|nr:GNAT family N-acetyltransferase [Serratia symbiotica]MBF1995211.1 GNAT family N-acetyltransferase [Serratia symbiotica]MBQ0956883.1 GNAT family N-acetyltransferase [Serratia symbiotica]QTP13592.1 GNAT family N-acetyltransferase [Serratia symbiotica]